MSFSFIRRLLSLNDLSSDPVGNPIVEVVLLSQNDPDTGLRVMKSIEHHKLQITRAIFMQGKAPYAYIPALNISLFLSASKADVVSAIEAGFPAGHVLSSIIVDDDHDTGLRIAFDFDGVVADDESEAVMHRTNDLNQFHAGVRLQTSPGRQPISPCSRTISATSGGK
jgi:5'-nucleotidase